MLTKRWCPAGPGMRWTRRFMIFFSPQGEEFDGVLVTYSSRGRGLLLPPSRTTARGYVENAKYLCIRKTSKARPVPRLIILILPVFFPEKFHVTRSLDREILENEHSRHFKFNSFGDIGNGNSPRPQRRTQVATSSALGALRYSHLHVHSYKKPVLRNCRTTKFLKSVSLHLRRPRPPDASRSSSRSVRHSMANCASFLASSTWSISASYATVAASRLVDGLTNPLVHGVGPTVARRYKNLCLDCRSTTMPLARPPPPRRRSSGRFPGGGPPYTFLISNVSSPILGDVHEPVHSVRTTRTATA